MANDAQHAGASAASLVDYFTTDHRGCDAVWADVEAAADAGDAARLATEWQRFQGGLLRHLGMEEQLMFPAFEAATGMTGGPTQVMRMEHEQMRGLLEQMYAAVARGDTEELLDQGDTLNILIQQHNMKEEGMLYPMAERALQVDWAELRGKLDAFELGA
jgi:iron-sulfur cluster repair protein YtfE (RIC family)